MNVVLKLFSENLNKMHVFPTPVTRSREKGLSKLHKKEKKKLNAKQSSRDNKKFLEIEPEKSHLPLSPMSNNLKR